MIVSPLPWNMYVCMYVCVRKYAYDMYQKIKCVQDRPIQTLLLPWICMCVLENMHSMCYKIAHVYQKKNMYMQQTSTVLSCAGLIFPGLIFPGLIFLAWSSRAWSSWPDLPGLIFPGLIFPGLIFPGLIFLAWSSRALFCMYTYKHGHTHTYIYIYIHIHTCYTCMQCKNIPVYESGLQIETNWPPRQAEAEEYFWCIYTYTHTHTHIYIYIYIYSAQTYLYMKVDFKSNHICPRVMQGLKNILYHC